MTPKENQNQDTQKDLDKELTDQELREIAGGKMNNPNIQFDPEAGNCGGSDCGSKCDSGKCTTPSQGKKDIHAQ